MKILVTGAKGFVGRKLCSQLKNIKDGKACNYGVTVTKVYEYDLDSNFLGLFNAINSMAEKIRYAPPLLPPHALPQASGGHRSPYHPARTVGIL